MTSSAKEGNSFAIERYNHQFDRNMQDQMAGLTVWLEEREVGVSKEEGAWKKEIVAEGRQGDIMAFLNRRKKD